MSNLNLVTCPGCGEAFAEEIKVAVADFRPLGLDIVEPVATEHFRAPDGRLFCCDDCFVLNGGS